MSSTSDAILANCDCNLSKSLAPSDFNTSAFSSAISTAPCANATVSAYSISLMIAPVPSIASTYSTLTKCNLSEIPASASASGVPSIPLCSMTIFSTSFLVSFICTFKSEIATPSFAESEIAIAFSINPYSWSALP